MTWLTDWLVKELCFPLWQLPTWILLGTCLGVLFGASLRRR